MYRGGEVPRLYGAHRLVTASRTTLLTLGKRRQILCLAPSELWLLQSDAVLTKDLVNEIRFLLRILKERRLKKLLCGRSLTGVLDQTAIYDILQSTRVLVDAIISVESGWVLLYTTARDM